MLRLAILCAVSLWAQDPYQMAPDNYKLEFENEWVRLSRVIYKPGDTLPEHDHPALNTVYVYLTDGGEVRFGHKKFPAAKRPPVKAGAVRYAKANQETHDTVYAGHQRSEYFRVELKTAVPPQNRYGRMAADSATPIEGEQVRIERLSCAADCAPSKWASVVVRIHERTGEFLLPGSAVPPGKI